MTIFLVLHMYIYLLCSGMNFEHQAAVIYIYVTEVPNYDKVRIVHMWYKPITHSWYLSCSDIYITGVPNGIFEGLHQLKISKYVVAIEINILIQDNYVEISQTKTESGKIPYNKSWGNWPGLADSPVTEYPALP